MEWPQRIRDLARSECDMPVRFGLTMYGLTEDQCYEQFKDALSCAGFTLSNS